MSSKSMTIRKALLALAVGTAALTTSACNTVKGAGQDIESVGDAGDKVTWSPQSEFARRYFVTELNKDEKIVSTRSSFNVANTIAAIALLLLVLGALKYFGVSPI
jgi:predicted small secreted protein